MTYRNLTNNPSWKEEVRRKISLNHANVKGENNPMYGRRGVLSPSYIDGRKSFKGSTYQKIMQINKVEKKCAKCGSTEKMNVHHIDENHSNNDFHNLVYLCSKCHNKLHIKNRDNKGRFLKKKGSGIYEQRL